VRSGAALCYVALVLTGAGPAAAQNSCAFQPSDLERGVFDQLNLARRDPAGYALRLEALEPSYEGKNRKLSEHNYLTTREGAAAVEEAVRELKKTGPRAPLAWNACLGASAAEHVRDSGPSGWVGHASRGGEPFDARIRRYVKRARRLGENIGYGGRDAEDFVEQLLIDDGVPDRGHRRNMLDPHFSAAGVACGPHAVYGTMCVIDFAQE